MTSTELFWKVVDQTIRLAELTSLEGDMREAPLWRDVRSLGFLLGTIIREQAGQSTFEAESGQSCLLENNAPLALSLQLRTPYVDPLSLIQIELLRRKRRGERRTELCSGRHHRRYLSRVEEYGLVIKMKKAGFFE